MTYRCSKWSKVSTELYAIQFIQGNSRDSLKPGTIDLCLGPSVVEKIVDGQYRYDNDTIQPMPT